MGKEARNPKKNDLIRGPFKTTTFTTLVRNNATGAGSSPPLMRKRKHVETYHKKLNLSNNATNYFYFYQQFKNIRQILKTPFVSFPFQRSKFNSTIFVARRFRGLTHSRYNFK